MTAMGFIASALIFSILLCSVYTDIREKRIPNALCFFGIFAGLLLSTTVTIAGSVSPDTELGEWITRLTLWQSLAGMIAAGVIPLVLYVVGAGGAGDVKLAWAIGAFAGMRRGTGALLCAYLLAGMAALIWLILTGRVWRIVANGWRSVDAWLKGTKFPPENPNLIDHSKGTVAMAPFMLAGLMLVIFAGEVE